MKVHYIISVVKYSINVLYLSINNNIIAISSSSTKLISIILWKEYKNKKI